MIPYSQLFILGPAQASPASPSWMGIDNFVDFVLPTRTNSLFGIIRRKINRQHSR